MALRLIGTATTDVNGNAVLEDGYTGTGAGMVDIIAQTTIDGSTVQSTPSEVTDCYKYDSGIDPNNNIWTIAYGTLTRDATNGYSILKESATNDGIIAIANIPLTDYHVEVDIMQVDGTANRNVFQILKSDYSALEYRDGTLGEWKHISIDETGIEANSRVRLITYGDCTEIRFKNFKLYPI